MVSTSISSTLDCTPTPCTRHLVAILLTAPDMNEGLCFAQYEVDIYGTGRTAAVPTSWKVEPARYFERPSKVSGGTDSRDARLFPFSPISRNLSQSSNSLPLYILGVVLFKIPRITQSPACPSITIRASFTPISSPIHRKSSSLSAEPFILQFFQLLGTSSAVHCALDAVSLD